MELVLCLPLVLLGLCHVTASETTLDDLQASIAKLTEVTEDLRTQLAKSEAKNKDLENRIDHFEKERGQRQLLVNPEPEVAFMATASNEETHLHLNQPIIYDAVITNIGNAYNPQSGLFHCPVAGTYLFNFNIMADNSNYLEASLTVNGNHIVHALSDHQAAGTSWDMGTTNVIIRLNEGDIVSVSIQHPPGENTTHGNRFNTFSGYLLRATN